MWSVGGIPKLLWSGEEGVNYIAVVEMLGPSLHDLMDYCGGSMSLKTVLLLAVRLIPIIEDLHSVGFVLRDFRPVNFVMGRKSEKVRFTSLLCLE